MGEQCLSDTTLGYQIRNGASANYNAVEIAAKEWLCDSQRRGSSLANAGLDGDQSLRRAAGRCGGQTRHGVG